MTNENKLLAYDEAIQEAQRFLRKARTAVARLETDEFAEYGCMETAAAKRASMDLTRSLSKLRKA